MTSKDIKIRNAKESDCEEIQKIASACSPLLVNPVYLNIVLTRYFGNSCMLLEENGEIIGFATGLKGTTEPNVFFFWQIGILPQHRRKGRSKSLIAEVARTAKEMGCTKMQFSISPTLETSKRAFQNFAQDIGSKVEKIDEMKYQNPISGTQGHEIFYQIKF